MGGDKGARTENSRYTHRRRGVGKGMSTSGRVRRTAEAKKFMRHKPTDEAATDGSTT